MARRSSGPTARLSGPMVASRSAPWPTKWTTLIDGRTERSASRYCPNPSQARSTLAPIPPAQPRTDSARPGAMGAGENEHIPTTSVVHPWRIFDSEDGQPM